MAPFQRRPPARGNGRQDFDAIVQIFIDNPERAFYKEEIVKEVRRRHPSISERRIEYIRTRLFASGHIQHEVVGGPHEKRYIYTGREWQPMAPPTRPTHLRPCELATLSQWRELLRARPPIVSQLARVTLDDDSANGPLHDALEESGLPALAEHFSTGCVHSECWALPILAGAEPLAQLKLTSKQAAAWLGISVNKFDWIVKDRRVQPASDRTAVRRGWVHHTYTWVPADIADLIDAPDVVAVRPV
jgi:hypothetical protein